MWTLRLRVWSGNLVGDGVVGLDTQASTRKFISLLERALTQAFPGVDVQADLVPGVNDTWETPADVVSLDLLELTRVSPALGDPSAEVREIAARLYWQGGWHVLSAEWEELEARVARRTPGPPPAEPWRMLASGTAEAAVTRWVLSRGAHLLVNCREKGLQELGELLARLPSAGGGEGPVAALPPAQEGRES